MDNTDQMEEVEPANDGRKHAETLEGDVLGLRQ